VVELPQGGAGRRRLAGRKPPARRGFARGGPRRVRPWALNGPIFRRALAASAASVVVLQTRCGGEPAPTAHDWAFTRRLVDAGKTLGIGLCDHLIVASAERWVSLQRRKPW
jgi:hypothetical protein